MDGECLLCSVDVTDELTCKLCRCLLHFSCAFGAPVNNQATRGLFKVEYGPKLFLPFFPPTLDHMVWTQYSQVAIYSFIHVGLWCFNIMFVLWFNCMWNEALLMSRCEGNELWNLTQVIRVVHILWLHIYLCSSLLNVYYYKPFH